MSRIQQFAATSLIALVSLATSFVERPFPDTVQEAPHIVRGKVGMSYANWVDSRDGSRQIFTFTELQVTEVFKGSLSPGKNIMMREMGGEKDGVGMDVAGSAKFQRGEDLVMMLGGPNPDGSYQVMGLMMGKYSVERNEQGQDYLVGAGLGAPGHHHENFDKEANKGSQTGSGNPTQWTLDALRQLVRSQGSEPRNNSEKPDLNQPTAPAQSENKQAADPASQLQTPLPSGEPQPSSWASAKILFGGIFLGLSLLSMYIIRRRNRTR